MSACDIKIRDTQKLLDLNDQKELTTFFNEQRKDGEEISVLILTEAGPDMEFTGVTVQRVDYEDPSEYSFFIFVTSKSNIILAKATYTPESYPGENMPYNMVLNGYAVIAKDAPNGIIKFFGTDKKAKQFYRIIRLNFSIEV